jgi:gluconolactonase
MIAGAVKGLVGLVDPHAVLERIATGSIWSEGPLWIPARQALRWSDIPNNRIREYDALTGEVTDYATAVEFTNGRCLNRDGSVIQCSHGRRRVERDEDGRVTAVVDQWQGVRLNSPNDVVIAPDGSIWFTDPPYGIIEEREGHPGEREYGDHYVFRHDAATGETMPVVIDVEEPNGLAFSPEGNLFYVADSSCVRKPAGVGNAHIRVYEVKAGRYCKNGRVFARIRQGFPDGIKVDFAGNVWSSSEVGVIVFDPSGQELGRILVPELTGNLCFGGPDGRDLYIAASTSIYRIRTETTDAWAKRDLSR